MFNLYTYEKKLLEYSNKEKEKYRKQFNLSVKKKRDEFCKNHEERMRNFIFSMCEKPIILKKNPSENQILNQTFNKKFVLSKFKTDRQRLEELISYQNKLNEYDRQRRNIEKKRNILKIKNNRDFLLIQPEMKFTSKSKLERIVDFINKEDIFKIDTSAPILEKIKKNNISRSNLSLSNNISNINTNNHTRNVINRTNRIMYPYTLNQLNNNSNGNEYNNTNTNNNINININKYDNNHNTINNNYRYNDNIMSYKNQHNTQRYQNIFNYAPLSSENGSNDYLILNKMNRRKVIYEPYTLIEYKKKYENMNRNGKKLGGLGANLGGEEWIKRQKLMERKKQYSDYVKNDNDEDFKKLNKRKLKTKSDNYAITNTISSKKASELSHDRLSEPIHKRYNIIKTESNVGKSKPIILPLIKERFVNKSQKNNYKINLKRNIGNIHNNNNEKYKINENKISMDGIYQNNGNEKDLKELIKQYEEYNGKW
jgi:hypothetical protein